MMLSALLTSAGINISLCILFLSLYSILRKQPGNVKVYFGRRVAEEQSRLRDAFILERFVPSPRWMWRALTCREDEILAAGGLDAVVFDRTILFSLRIFGLVSPLCVFGILPANYWSQKVHDVQIPSVSLDIFTIANVVQRSKLLWVHFSMLYFISVSACILLYHEYKRITRLRLAHITRCAPYPGHFTVLVRAIPKSTKEPFSETVGNFFMEYYACSYLCHQIVYKSGKVQKLMTKAKTAYRKFQRFKATSVDPRFRQTLQRCCLCGTKSNSSHLFHKEIEFGKKNDHDDPNLNMEDEECAAAFVFFKTRYSALVTSEVLQTSNPMEWVTDLAPEPNDVYWSTLWLPYKQLWIRQILTLMGTIVFMLLFLIPVTFVQGLTQLEQLQQRLPFLKGILKKKFIGQLVTGYLPSVILQLFLYTIPPTMMLFSTLEGPICHSGRKKSACLKVLYFTVWNVFFFNVLSGSVISQLNVLSSPKDIPTQLARAVPGQATFFITYVLTSGWASLSSELLQLFGLIWNFIMKYLFGRKEDPDSIPSFPYHTELPKLLLFGLLGFTCSILAPLILPFLLVYFFLGYVVYRNQFLNVYYKRYETGGLMWPIVHNTTIFSLVLTQIICLGVFGLKESSVTAVLTIPLVLLTLLFNQYCRKRFYPLFKSFPAKDIIEMDKKDEQSGRLEEIHQRLHSAYCQFRHENDDTPFELVSVAVGSEDEGSSSQEPKTKLSHPTLKGLPLTNLAQAVHSLSLLSSMQKRGLGT